MDLRGQPNPSSKPNHDDGAKHHGSLGLQCLLQQPRMPQSCKASKASTEQDNVNVMPVLQGFQGFHWAGQCKCYANVKLTAGAHSRRPVSASSCMILLDVSMKCFDSRGLSPQTFSPSILLSAWQGLFSLKLLTQSPPTHTYIIHHKHFALTL